jgi:hypothetical protein
MNAESFWSGALVGMAMFLLFFVQGLWDIGFWRSRSDSSPNTSVKDQKGDG